MDANLASARKTRSNAAVAVLSIGAIAALALGLGGIWVARTGIAVAGLAGLAALVLMFRAMSSQEVAHQGTLAALRDQAHADATRMERRHHVESMGIIERFTARVADLRTQIEGLEAQAADLREQLAQRDRLVASMRATQESLLGNAVEMRSRIAELERQIALREIDLREAAAREVELRARLGEDADQAAEPTVQPEADIVALPRRLQLSARPVDDEVVIWSRAVGH